MALGLPMAQPDAEPVEEYEYVQSQEFPSVIAVVTTAIAWSALPPLRL